MNECPPAFEWIKRKLDIKQNKAGLVVMPYSKLEEFVRFLLPLVSVDEEWYKATYPDVAAGIASGNIPTAKEHFVMHGYFEGRLPHDVQVDEKWYLASNPDVAAGLKTGGPAPKQHFLEHGYREGRSPTPEGATEDL
jgi:hypothetical protein